MARVERLIPWLLLALLAAGAAGADYEVVKSTHGNLIISGYAIGRYTYRFGDVDAGGPPTTSTFSARSASLIFRGDIFEYAGYFIYVDPACDDVLIDAYGTLNVIPHTGLTVGQFLVPFSRESYTSTSKLLMVDRSMVSANVAPPLGRDVGAQLEYALRPEGNPRWATVAVAGINGSGPNRPDENTSKDLAVRVAANPLPWEETKGLTVEGYYYLGKPEFYDPDNPLERWGTADGVRYGGCLAFDNKTFSLQTEWLRRHTTYERPYGATYEYAEGGYYVQGSYKIPAPLPWLQIVEPCGRWESYDPDADRAGDATDAVTGGVNLHFDPDHHCKFMANSQHFLEEETAVDNDKVSAQFQVRF
jgi:hypothetical protein